MKLIADSGSTKTDWRLLDDAGKIEQYRTPGIHPLFQSQEEISILLKQELLPKISGLKLETNLEIYFYGTGCSSLERCQIVKSALWAVFPTSNIEINHDLLGAARSLCGNKPGVAAILGTGSNSCLYDGNLIIDNITSLGYILGDEGSGAFIGKKFLSAFFYRELPTDIEAKFLLKYPDIRETVLDKVYKQPNPNRYLASFCTFLSGMKTHPYVAELIYACFSEFMQRNILKYSGHQSLKLHCTGSVGFYFADLLRKAATDNGISLGLVTESPIAGLTLFHSEMKE